MINVTVNWLTQPSLSNFTPTYFNLVIIPTRNYLRNDRGYIYQHEKDHKLLLSSPPTNTIWTTARFSALFSGKFSRGILPKNEFIKKNPLDTLLFSVILTNW